MQCILFFKFCCCCCCCCLSAPLWTHTECKIFYYWFNQCHGELFFSLSHSIHVLTSIWWWLLFFLLLNGPQWWWWKLKKLKFPPERNKVGDENDSKWINFALVAVNCSQTTMIKNRNSILFREIDSFPDNSSRTRKYLCNSFFLKFNSKKSWIFISSFFQTYVIIQWNLDTA